MKRNSTFEPEFRELPVGVRQQREHRELASELLLKICSADAGWFGRMQRVGVDGGPPLQGKSIR